MTSSTAAYGDVYPSLTYDDAAAAIDWLCRAFGFAHRPADGSRGTISGSG